MKRIVIDTGPLAALFNGADKYHQQAVQFIRQLKAPLVTNPAVVTETVFLLDFNRSAQYDFLEWMGKGAVGLHDITAGDLIEIKSLMQKYSNLPMDFTDGSLVALCDKLDTKHIATIDSDFEVYRFGGRGRFRNVFLA